MYIPTSLPGFTYTGQYSTELRADWGWVIVLKSGGTLKFTDRNRKIDVCVVGGGSGGSTKTNGTHGANGGGGGAVVNRSGVSAAQNTGYSITIGSGGTKDKAGGALSAFGITASGGATEAGGS